MASLLSVSDCFGDSVPFLGCMLWDINSSLMDFFLSRGDGVPSFLEERQQITSLTTLCSCGQFWFKDTFRMGKTSVRDGQERKGQEKVLNK